jgi:alpha-galactosidase
VRFSIDSTFARLHVLALAVAADVLFCGASMAASVTLATNGDAAIVHDPATESWSIGAAGIALTVGLGPNRALLVRRGIVGSAERNEPLPDTALTLNGESITLTEAGTGLRFEAADVEKTTRGVHLIFRYSHRTSRAIIRRHYASYPGSPIVEGWTTVDVADGSAATVADLNGWHVVVPSGTLQWVNGLRGDAPDNPVDEAFSIGTRDLADGETFVLGADRRSSERFLPLTIIDVGTGRWFAGVQWSGRWRIECARAGAAIDVRVDIPDTVTTVTGDRPLEMPHSFIGFARSAADVGRALRGFIATGIRDGRPIRPLVTFNTWFPYGARIDEALMVQEIDRTAALGIELFVLDAGWHNGAGSRGFYDFDTGLGTWTVDPGRFPGGLRLLADRAHERGMKFGLWVEPGRVSLDTVGQEGLALDEWLAQSDGRNVSDTSATICFAGRAGWSWVRARLFALLDDVQPDYLKWDNNAWVNCNRAGHDHGADDGNLRQVQGLYALLRELRERYPSLLIENVAGGGSRLDFEMLRHTDVAWVDDRTSPAIRVRHNLQGVSGLFPPGYLLSFVLDSPTAPLSGAADPLTEIRSSMIGAFGFGYRSTALRPWLTDAFRDAIAAYSQVRDILHDADAMLLSGQAPAPDEAAWDVNETLNATTAEAVLVVFHQPGANDRVTVRPRGLDADANYRVRSLDAGDLGVVTGRVLMEDGVDIVQGAGTQSHVLVIRRAP